MAGRIKIILLKQCRVNDQICVFLVKISRFHYAGSILLTHWGRVTHICVSKLTIIGSDNGLSPGRRQAIIWTNAGILLIRTLGTNFSEILSAIHAFSFKKMHLKMSSAKWRPFCLGLNVLILLLLLHRATAGYRKEYDEVSHTLSLKARWFSVRSEVWGYASIGSCEVITCFMITLLLHGHSWRNWPITRFLMWHCIS